METRQIAQLLRESREGDPQALPKLMESLYDPLRVIARKHMRGENAGHTLQATAVVNEAYERLVGADVAWENRAHFLAVMAQVMRRVLVDHARARASQKRGAGAARVDLEQAPSLAVEDNLDLLDIEAALQALARRDARKARVIEMHYFGGMTYPEMASALGVSENTVDRDLRMAKAWLKATMG